MFDRKMILFCNCFKCQCSSKLLSESLLAIFCKNLMIFFREMKSIHTYAVYSIHYISRIDFTNESAPLMAIFKFSTEIP